MCTMNCRVLLFTSMILLLAGCRTKFSHYDLPDNHISFPADGGVVEYVYPSGLMLSSIYIGGEKHNSLLLYDDSKIVGQYSEWVNFIEGWRIGDVSYHAIEVKPNPTRQSRSAELHFDLGKQYGEIYIYQEGRSE